MFPYFLFSGLFMIPRLCLPPDARLLLSPCAALPHPPPARRPSFQIVCAECAPARTRSLPRYLGTATADREKPLRQLHPPHSAHKVMPRPSSSLREPVE